jgi:hypothetical protein
MVFNTTFNNISIISWQLVLLVEETWENIFKIDLKYYEYSQTCLYRPLKGVLKKVA